MSVAPWPILFLLYLYLISIPGRRGTGPGCWGTAAGAAGAAAAGKAAAGAASAGAAGVSSDREAGVAAAEEPAAGAAAAGGLLLSHDFCWRRYSSYLPLLTSRRRTWHHGFCHSSSQTTTC